MNDLIDDREVERQELIISNQPRFLNKTEREELVEKISSEHPDDPRKLWGIPEYAAEEYKRMVQNHNKTRAFVLEEIGKKLNATGTYTEREIERRSTLKEIENLIRHPRKEEA